MDTTTWEWAALPDLNIARCNHSSTSLGDATYVACGYSDENLYLNSVERLEMGGSAESQAWSLIDMPQLTPRNYPVFSQIGPDQLCILGGEGYRHGWYISDGVILNVKTQEVTVINPASEIEFECRSESFMEKQGLLLSLVCDSGSIVHLMRYCQADNTITSVHNYSREY